MLLKEVCAAKAIAIPATPAAPQIAESFTPNKLRTHIIKTKSNKYFTIRTIKTDLCAESFVGGVRFIARTIIL